MPVLHIYSGENHVGDAVLEHLDSGMGVASGTFQPNQRYRRIMASVVAAADQRHRGHHATVGGLEARTVRGEVVATGFIQIDDFADVAVDPEISVQFEDREQAERVWSSAV